MRILSVSDRVEPVLYDRFDPDRFGPVDLILACGDLPPEYLTFLNNALKAPLFFVKGNHDIRYEDKPLYGCVNIHARVMDYKGLRFLGFEGSRWYNGGPNQYTENQMRRTLYSLYPRLWWRHGVDIVITHAPPRYINDAEDLCHRGFRTYHRLIKRFSPRYLIHGHIHATFNNDTERIVLVDRTQVINTFGYYLLEIENE